MSKGSGRRNLKTEENNKYIEVKGLMDAERRRQNEPTERVESPWGRKQRKEIGYQGKTSVAAQLTVLKVATTLSWMERRL